VKLLLWLRDPAKLTAPFLATIPASTLLVGDLRDQEPHAAAIASAQRLIQRPRPGVIPSSAHQVNVGGPSRSCLGRTDRQVWKQRLNLLSPPAQPILDRDLKPAAGKGGGLRHRINPSRTKALCLAGSFETHPLAERSCRCFQTLVFRMDRCNRASKLPPATSPPGQRGGALGCGWPAGCGLRPSFHFIQRRRHRPGLRES